MKQESCLLDSFLCLCLLQYLHATKIANVKTMSDIAHVLIPKYCVSSSGTCNLFSFLEDKHFKTAKLRDEIILIWKTEKHLSI
jgi:hypothetical protein